VEHVVVMVADIVHIFQNIHKVQHNKHKEMAIKRYIVENINNKTERNLTLYHGSNTEEIIETFHDNQFFTANDYIANNYAYNWGGLIYEVKVNSLKPLFLKGNYKMFGGRSMQTEEPEQYELEYNMVKKLYGDKALQSWLSRGFYPSPSYVFYNKGYEPVIEFAKKLGFDSLKFIDESFDTFVKDITYVIFNGRSVEIVKSYEPIEF
jgi:hypothetical protein